jgi:hypothetical protein
MKQAGSKPSQKVTGDVVVIGDGKRNQKDLEASYLRYGQKVAQQLDEMGQYQLIPTR